MREIPVSKIKDTIEKLLREAAWNLPLEVEEALNDALAHESSPVGREILRELIKNAEIARSQKLPICQDTGMAVVFIELGEEVVITGGNIYDAINEAVKTAYKDLRKSIVIDPFNRENTNDNTPANIHVEIVQGDTLKIKVLPKGGGAENASIVKMFLPTALQDEISDFIVEQVKLNGPKACPPIILGIGIGGAFDTVATLAKKALLRPLKSHSTHHDIKQMEKNILERINKTGIGPMGVGGNITALAVHIATAPCHIASMPVAINFQCHAHRYKEETI